jgi:thioredoxin reductase (NADPH)
VATGDEVMRMVAVADSRADSGTKTADSGARAKTADAHVAAQTARRPAAFETSMPGVFAVGDVRLGSIKRVAGAVGEGSNAIRMVHEYLARH